MSQSKFVLRAVFITLKEGLLIFHSSHETVWQEIYEPDLQFLEIVTYESFTVQQLFLTGLLENLRDLDPEADCFKIKYRLEIKSADQILPVFEPRMKYLEYFKIASLSTDSELRLFCYKFLA